jgi:hypothetical protein
VTATSLIGRDAEVRALTELAELPHGRQQALLTAFGLAGGPPGHLWRSLSAVSLLAAAAAERPPADSQP